MLVPEEVRRVLLTEPPAFLTQFIHSGLFVGVFRYLAPLCEEQLGVAEDAFWFIRREPRQRIASDASWLHRDGL